MRYSIDRWTPPQKSGGIPRVSTRFSLSVEIEQADAGGGTAESVSRDQILGREQGQGNIHLPCSAGHEQDWQPYPVDAYSAKFDDDTYRQYICTRVFIKCFCSGLRKTKMPLSNIISLVKCLRVSVLPPPAMVVREPPPPLEKRLLRT